jgi:hypothetical protein
VVAFAQDLNFGEFEVIRGIQLDPNVAALLVCRILVTGLGTAKSETGPERQPRGNGN